MRSRSVQVKELHESKHGPVLYGFDELPPLDVKITWSEAHVAFVEPGNHRVKFLGPTSGVLRFSDFLSPFSSFGSRMQLNKFFVLQEWQYFLNKGSKIRVSYCVNSPSGAALSLVIAEGESSESLIFVIVDCTSVSVVTN